jgi:putative FmdB family regulatory protein
MPTYDFRCKNCGTEFSLFFKSYINYEAATPACANCNSVDLSRIIKKVNVSAPTRDYTSMSSDQMLNVLESGDGKQVGQMFQQIGGTDPAIGAEYQEVTQRLLDGESMDSVEKTMQKRDSVSNDDD